MAKPLVLVLCVLLALTGCNDYETSREHYYRVCLDHGGSYWEDGTDMGCSAPGTDVPERS